MLIKKILVGSSLVILLTGCESIYIRGKIINGHRKTIAGARIKLVRNDTVVYSNSEGIFFIHNLRLNDTIVISARGYETTTDVVRYYSGRLPVGGNIVYLLDKESP